MPPAITLARLAALVALFGFFLPWAEVSCSGQPLVHASGVQLITGDTAGTGRSGLPHHDLWIAASFGLVGAGLVGSLIARSRRAAVILVVATLAAAVASLIGVSQEVPSADVQAQLTGGASGGEASQQAAARQLISARLEYGYFVTLSALIVAVAASGLALAGQRSAGRRVTHDQDS